MMPTLWAVAQLAFLAPRAALLSPLNPRLAAVGPQMRQGGLILSRRANRRKRGALAEDQRKARQMLGVPLGQGERVPALAEPRTDEALAAVRGRIAPFRYLCVLDVEATCDRSNRGWAHEIIELPIVLVDLHTLTVVNEFRSFVRPTVVTTLTEFCTELTGIGQSSVDEAPPPLPPPPPSPPPPPLAPPPPPPPPARRIPPPSSSPSPPHHHPLLHQPLLHRPLLRRPLLHHPLLHRRSQADTLPEVLQQIDAWLSTNGLEYGADRRDFAFATDGPWDLMQFLDGECERKGIRKPDYFDKWVNLKDLYADFYKVKRCKIARMLELQGMQPEGRLHSGIDDTRNIARIAMQMGRDGCRMYLNEALPMKRRASSVQGLAEFKPMDLSQLRSS